MSLSGTHGTEELDDPLCVIGESPSFREFAVLHVGNLRGPIGEALTTHVQRRLYKSDDVLVVADDIVNVDIEGVRSELLHSGHARHYGILTVKRLGAELMPNNVIGESVEGRLEVALLELLVDPSKDRHVGMFGHDGVHSFLRNVKLHILAVDTSLNPISLAYARRHRS
jgi:hypothetical protein